MLTYWDELSVFDPRNLAGRSGKPQVNIIHRAVLCRSDKSFEKVQGLLCEKVELGEEDEEATKARNEHIENMCKEWTRYIQV